MIFNSFNYIFFLFVVLSGIELFRKRNIQVLMLLGFSYYFYYTNSGLSIFFLLACTVISFLSSQLLCRTSNEAERKTILAFGILSNLTFLFLFKYLGFFLANADRFFEFIGVEDIYIPILSLPLPIGISFYTFQCISYVVASYRKQISVINDFSKVSLYISFFPQLVAGPIVRVSEFMPQIKSTLRPNVSDLRHGTTLILYGLIKKVIVADNLSVFVESISGASYSSSSLASQPYEIWFAVVSFSVQIYCDFSGYTDIAIGSARLLGIKLPENFKHPYFSENIAIFWRNWHITLSNWLRDYIYIPLGGSRRGNLRTNFNLMATMLLCGLWHGASWNFVLWGFYNGFLLIAYRWLSRSMGAIRFSIPKPIKILGTYWLVLIGWIFFLIKEPDQQIYWIRNFVVPAGRFSELINFSLSHPFLIFILTFFFVTHLISFSVSGLSDKIGASRSVYWFGYAIASCLTLYILAPFENVSFIYFQF